MQLRVGGIVDSKELNGLIRAQLEHQDEVDLWQLTDAVVSRIDESDLRSALHTALRGYVATFIGAERRSVVAPRVTADIQPGPSKRSVGSVAWKKKLDVLVSIEGNGTMKRLGNCTAAEVQLIANGYRARVQHMTEQAEWYARIADAMAAVKVKHVADLPENTLRPLLDKVAA